MEAKKMSLSVDKANLILDDFLVSTKKNKETRASQFSKYQHFILDGEQWDGIDDPKLGDPKVTLNESETYIDTYLSKLFPRNLETGALEVGVRVRGIDKEKNETLLLEVYQNQKLPAVLLEQAQNFLIGGDACIYYPQNPSTLQADIISLDPTACFFTFNGSNLEQFAFEDEVSVSDIPSNSSSFSWMIDAVKKFLGAESSPFKKVKRLTYWSNQYQIIRIDKDVRVFENKHGFIPASWIPNRPKAHTFEGRSEAKSLYTLEQHNNKMESDISKRVHDNTRSPLLLATDRDASKLEKSMLTSGILPVEKGGSGDFLKMPEAPELLGFVDHISAKMDKKMAINEAVNGAVKSNVSSLSMLYYFSPLLDRIALKRVYWDQFFRDLNRAILLYAGTTKNLLAEPVYQPAMMQDHETKIKNALLLLNNRLMTYREAIDILRPSENADEKFAEIQKEFAELSKIEGFLNVNPAQPTPAPPVV